MKTLLLLRHAKSSWDNTDLADFDRPLNSRGLEAAPVMGNVIYKKKLQTGLILSSLAKRARQTSVLVKETAQIDSKIQFEERIYEASPLALMQIISEQEDKKESLLLIGHNPGLEGLVKVLTGETITMVTAALVKINLNVESWEGVSAGCGEMEFLITPEEVKPGPKD